jgi:exodeoxyribonuclease X
MSRYVPRIIDTETTGKGADAQVIELAYMDLPATPEEFVKARLEDLPIVHKFYGHTSPMELGALAVHKINPDKLEGLESFGGLEMKADRMYVGHNVDFDTRMIGSEGAPRACTLAMARGLFPDLDSYTQGAVLLHVGKITNRPYSWALDLIERAHTADQDVMNCARIFKLMVYMLLKRDVAGKLTWEDVYRFENDCRIPKVMPFGKFQGKPVTEVSKDWAEWYKGTESPDYYILTALRRAGVIQ